MDALVTQERQVQLMQLQPNIQKYLDNSGLVIPFQAEKVEFTADDRAVLEVEDAYILNFTFGIGENARYGVKVQIKDDDGDGLPILAPRFFDIQDGNIQTVTQASAVKASDLRAAVKDV